MPDEPAEEKVLFAWLLLEAEPREEADLGELVVLDAAREEPLFGDPELFAEADFARELGVAADLPPVLFPAPEPRVEADFVPALFVEEDLAPELFAEPELLADADFAPALLAEPELRAELDFVPELRTDELDAFEREVPALDALGEAVVFDPVPFVVELLAAGVFEPDVFEVELLAEEPLAEEPLAEEPLAEEPLAEEPLAEEPLAEEPFQAALLLAEDFEPEVREELFLLDALFEPELLEARADDFVSPLSARCLFTVRAAISFARFVERPASSSLSLTCSYWRSRFALQGFCGIRPPLAVEPVENLPGP